LDPSEAIANQVLAMEQVALERWGKGDPDAYLDITADDVSYFDPFLNQRIDGIESLKKWYGAFRGRIRIAFDEIAQPRVQVIGDTAILTMQFISHSSVGKARWNCTEVYQERSEGWRIVHTHWSPTRPAVKVPAWGM
jgi:ketosteroid isomerase-like protein